MAAPTTERTVLIAVDASPHAKNAFEWYMENMNKSTDLVVIAHVMEAPHLPSFSFKHGIHLPVDEWQKVIQEQLERVKKLEQDYEGDLLARKQPHKMLSEQDKNPGQGIVRIAETENASVVVMGTRGLDALRRTLLGSVSDYVVRHSTVPVVICPLSKKK